MASGLKGKTVSAVGSQRLSEEPGLHSPCELFPCCTFLVLTITITSLIETKVRERERKLVSWNSGTLYGGKGEEAADDRKCEEGKALGRQQISWKMGKRARVAWTGIYEPVLCPAQEAQFSEHWERIIFHLHYSCSFVYSTRWENLHPNSRNAQTHEYYLYLIRSLILQA